MSAENTEAAAAAWLAREDRGLAHGEQAALAQWLDESSLNRVAYLRLKASWQRADRLGALRRPDLRRTYAPMQRRSRLPWLAVAASLVVAVAGTAIYLFQPAAPRTFTTAVGQVQSVQLSDGTRMELNTDTRLHAEVTAAARTVTLDSGEAYFEVVHDAKRPFIVYAGPRRITDLGTKFSVFRNGNDVRVTVREGQVRVDQIGSPAVATPVTVDGGHAVMAQGAATLVIGRSAKDISEDLSWRGGLLVFNQKTLAEAAAQFNRYNDRKIVVEGNARKIRIGGSFKMNNVDGFAVLLHEGFGLSISNRDNTIVVSR